MKGFTDKISPLEHHISFDKLLKQYDEMAESEDLFSASKAKYILNAQAPFPELRNGFTDMSLLEKHKEVIQIILQDLFSSVLTNNEIKTATTPYTNITFNSSKRFESGRTKFCPGNKEPGRRSKLYHGLCGNPQLLLRV